MKQMSILDEVKSRFVHQSVEIDNVAWSFIETKEKGFPLILLPGAQGTAEIYFNQLLAAGQDIRIIAVTYPEVSDCEALAHGFRSFLDRLGVSRAVFSGSSFGALWLQFFAARFPEYVAGAVLANAFISGRSKQDFFDKMLAMSGPDIVSAMNAGVRAAAGKSAQHAQLAQVIGELVGPVQSGEGLQSRLRGVRFSDPAPAIDIPAERIALIECDDDPLIDPSMQNEIAARYSGSARHRIEGGGHYPAVLKPDAYTGILRDFHAATAAAEAARI